MTKLLRSILWMTIAAYKADYKYSLVNAKWIYITIIIIIIIIIINNSNTTNKNNIYLNYSLKQPKTIPREPVADDVKLLVRPLSKETTQMDLNKLSH